MRPRSHVLRVVVTGGGRSAVVVFHLGKKMRLPGCVMYALPVGEVQMTVPTVIGLGYRYSMQLLLTRKALVHE